MKYKNVSLPYPVLGIYDDVYPLLGDDCIQMSDPVKTATEYQFGIDLKQGNKDIAQLVNEGKAEYACIGGKTKCVKMNETLNQWKAL